MSGVGLSGVLSVPYALIHDSTGHLNLLITSVAFRRSLFLVGAESSSSLTLAADGEAKGAFPSLGVVF
jgi:hypothetical protein